VAAAETTEPVAEATPAQEEAAPIEPADPIKPAAPVEPETPADPIAPSAPEAEAEPEAPREGPAQAALMPTSETRYGDADALPPQGASQPEMAFDEASDALPSNVSYAGDAEGAVDDDAATQDLSDRNDTVEVTEDEAPPPETIGGESDQFEGNGAEEASRRRSSRMLRSYRIQEVIRRRQILLIQVVKEERGTKGAALTTYISLAGRYCVLMPNSPRGGGISRKITSASDRKRLKEITAEMEIPKGMGLIVRTAGAARPKPEIKRDCEYLMRLWDDIREHTLRSMAPALIYEEASLIKRSIRDVY
jgi:ribonuclease E